MPLRFASARFSFCLTLFLVALVSLGADAQAPNQQQTTAPATAQNEAQTSTSSPIPMEQERHHHLVFQNAYVKVFYVEIPAHESTLYHHHDLPYVSLPPPPLSRFSPPATGGREATERSVPPGPRVSYALGGFSHTVNNKTDVALRNVAVELLRPQGTARDRCAEIIRGQPLTDCPKKPTLDPDTASGPRLASVAYPLFETDEILVDYWDVAPGAGIWASDPHVSVLVGGLDGIVNVILNGDGRPVPQAGLIWLLPGSKTAFEAGKDSPGHFVTIVFKDSALK